MKLGHPIRSVARQTGLSPHLIRIWERRYKAVSPVRTNGNHRLYSDEDVHRLRLLRDAVEQGESISQISDLTTSDLQLLVGHDERMRETSELPASIDDAAILAEFLRQCLDSVHQFDSARLESLLLSASIQLSRRTLIEGLLDSLLTKIGELWYAGKIKVVHEHMAATVVRSFLGNIFHQSEIRSDAPRIVCATPASQVHELGALMVAITADSEGWNATFLGADIPADDIVSASVAKNADAVALSITYPGESNSLIAELRTLRKLLPAETMLFVGGRSAPEFANVISEIRATLVLDLSDLRSKLRAARILSG